MLDAQGSEVAAARPVSDSETIGSARDALCRIPTVWVILAVAAATTLRLGMAWLRPQDAEADPDAYLRLAATLLEHRTYAQPGGEVPSAFRPPLYPLLLAALLNVGISVRYAVCFWNLLGCLTQVVVVVIVGRSLGLNRIWVLLAMCGVVLDPLQIRYSSLAMTECVAGGLLSTAVMCVFAARRSGRPAHWGFAGALFGVASMCRPICLVCMVFLLLGYLREAMRSDKLRVACGHVVCCGLMAAAVLSPWIIRNAMVLRAFVPATTHGGYTLLLGNNRTFYSEVVRGEASVWDGDSLDAWQRAMKREASASGVSLVDEVAMDSWYYRKSCAEISAAPLTFVQACVLRWSRFFAISGGVNHNAMVRFVCGVWYLTIGLGLLSSLFAGWSSHSTVSLRSDIQMLWLAVGSFFAMHTVYWANARMRTPLTVILCVLSVAGWRWVLQINRNRRDSSRPAVRASLGG